MTENEVIEQLLERVQEHWKIHDHRSIGYTISNALQYLEQHLDMAVYSYVVANEVPDATYVYISSNDSIRHHCMLNSTIQAWLVVISKPPYSQRLSPEPAYHLYEREEGQKYFNDKGVGEVTGRDMLSIVLDRKYGVEPNESQGMY